MISVYIFKELHNEQESYWPTIYRAGAAVVSAITSFSKRCTNYGFRAEVYGLFMQRRPKDLESSLENGSGFTYY